jgi:hypothetical protein
MRRTALLPRYLRNVQDPIPWESLHGPEVSRLPGPRPGRNLPTMNPRAWLLAALFASPAWSQEPGPDATALSARSFDLRGDAVRKIVNDTASAQVVAVQVVETKSAVADSDEVVYVPPEKQKKPVPQKISLPMATPDTSDGPISSLVDVLLDEVLGIDADGVDTENLMLNCRVQKEFKTSRPDPGICVYED